MCSCKSVCLRHWAFLGPCKNSPYNMPLAVTQMHCPACLPRAEQGQKRRGGAGREHPVGAVACFVCFLLQTVPWTWELQIYPLLPFTSRNSQSIFLGWRQVRGEECVLWEWTACHAPPAMSEAPGCSCPDLLRLSELHYSSHWFFFFIVFICFVLFVLFCFVYLFVLGGKHPCATRKPWYKHNLNGERFCPGGTTPRLSEVLLRRQIKPIRKPLEPRAVFGLLFPPWDISFYCFSHFLWVSVGPLGGAATAGKGSGETSCPRGHMGSLVLFLAQTPSVNFRHTSARKVGPRW